MPYVKKERKIESRMKADNIIEEYQGGCVNKRYDNVEIPVDGGSVKMFKPTFFHDDIIQATVSAADERMLGFFGKLLNVYKERCNRNYSNRDSFVMYFEKEINASEFLGDKQEVLMKVPLTVQVHSARLKKDNENLTIDKYIPDNYEKLQKPFVRELILNSGEMERLNGYVIKKGIDADVYKKSLVMAETAKRELGFDYKRIEGDCLKGVCSCPEEISGHDLPNKLIKETKKDSFKEMVINLKKEYKKYNERLDIEIKPNNIIGMEAENASYLFKDILGSLNLEIPEGSASSYMEHEHFVAPEKLEKAAKIATILLGAGLLYEAGKMAYESTPPISSVLPRIYAATELGALMGGLYITYRGIKAVSPFIHKAFYYAAEKTKGSPIVHPIRTVEKRKAEKEKLLVDYFKSLKIKKNDTRPSSCLFQIDEDACLKIARANLENKETEKPEGG